jgi:two-component system, cell cycle sensor histidine kinase and response regulator CckA
MLRKLLRAYLALCAVMAILGPFVWARRIASLGLGAVLVLSTIGALLLLRRGRVRAASALWLGGISAVLLVMVLLSRGIASPLLMGYVVISSTAYWLLGRRVAIWMSWGTAALVAALAAVALMGVRLPEYFPFPPVVMVCNVLCVLALAMVPLDEVMRELKGSLAVARTTIVELRQAEAEALASESRYRDLFEHANDIIWCQDAEGRCTAVNEAALRMLQMKREDLIGKPVAGVVLPEFHQVMRERRARQLQGEELPPIEYCVRSSDGRLIWLEANSRMMRDIEGQPVGLHGIARDVTERKRAEEERARLQAALYQAQKLESVGRLAGGIAHDFNNLLTVINGYSQLALAALAEGDPLHHDLSEIARAGERAAGLTRQLLAFSRKQVLNRRPLNLNQVVKGMTPMLDRLVGEDVELVVSADTLQATVHADPHQLEQVVMNLAVNARDAMPGGGRLTIETGLLECGDATDCGAAHWVTLEVSDTGTGMDEETREHIFEPFFTTKDSSKGTGLGLSMVQGIVEQSGGSIEVVSQLNKGTTFRIFLPLMPAAGESEPEAAERPARGRETILVVEDHADVRNYAVKILEELGYRVKQADGAAAAIELCSLKGEPVDLVLTDVVMPHLSGRDLADRLQELLPGIRVVFMSGYTDDIVLRHGVAGERVHFIQKPFNPQALGAKVREALEAAPGADAVEPGSEWRQAPSA